VIDSNVSTITAEADKVLWVDEQEPWIEHVELQAGRDIELSDRVHHYNTSLGRAHQVPVHTTIILLRPGADGPDVNGTYERRYRNGDVYDWFRYDVVRIWLQPVEEVLASGLPVLPLAPVAKVEPEQVPKVLLAISERLVRETSPEQAATFWAATKVMMGLRYPKEQVEEFERGVSAMILGVRGIEESSVYQDIFAKGEAKGKAEGEAKGKAEGEAKGKAEGEAKGRLESARLAVLRLGRKKFGPPAENVRAAIDAIDDVDQLGSLLDRVLDVSTWHELLATIAPSS
jgi:predicted transposase YdaD